MKFALGFVILSYFSPCFAEFLSLDNGFASKPEDPRKVEVSVISADRAQQLMNKIIFQRDKIALYNPTDCPARTTMIARLAEAETDSIKLGRAYLENHLNLYPVNSPRPHPTGLMHVASVVGIKGKQGEISTMIIDPTFFDHPVTVDEWKNKLIMPNMGEHPFYFGNRFQYSAKGGGVPIYEKDWNPTSVNEAEKTNSIWLPKSIYPYYSLPKTEPIPASAGAAQ